MKHDIGNSRVLIIAPVFAALFLTSCNPGEAGIGVADQALFVQAPGSPITVGGGPNDVSIGDMNGDEKPDLVVTLGQESSRFARAVAT